MSVLNQNSDEEPLECPLCMEFLELDDINFYPCSCCYQICRFCWNKIRTEGSGLCPACRSPYSENPADFKPLTAEEMAKIKAEKRQKDQAKKQKISENRKHLANVRVVQKNLVFVVGLSPRLADPEVLRRQEYFGKFGKMHKVVINLSTAYAGNQNQGPSASAYVTYFRSEDALRAIQAVSNIYIDGRTLKASLGTTKYCSHFMKNQPCPKPDCMYLHELGDEAASFTKEEMQQGKHTEYERMLHEEMLNQQGNSDTLNDDRTGFANSPTVEAESRLIDSKKAKSPSTSPTANETAESGVGHASRTPSPKCGNGSTSCGSVSSNTSISSNGSAVPWPNVNGRANFASNGESPLPENNLDSGSERVLSQNLRNKTGSSLLVANNLENLLLHGGKVSNEGTGWDNGSSPSQKAESKDDLYAEDDLGFDPFHETQKALAEMLESESQFAGSYTTSQSGFSQQQQHHSSGPSIGNFHSSSTLVPPGLSPPSSSSNMSTSNARLKQPPPGFDVMNYNQSSGQHFLSSDIHNFGHLDGFSSSGSGFGNVHSREGDFGYGSSSSRNMVMGGGRNHSGGGHGSHMDRNGIDQLQHQFRQMGFEKSQQQSNFSDSKDWQDGFRALLPNVNVSFGALPQQQQQQQQHQHHLLENVLESTSSRFDNLPSNALNDQHNVGHQMRHSSGWQGVGNGINDWTVLDPAIVGGQLSEQQQQQPHQPQPHIRPDSPSNWIKANLEQLTSETNTAPPSTNSNQQGSFNIGPLLPSSFNNFSLSSPPTSIPSGSNGGPGGVGLAGWTQPLLANTPPPGFSLNRTAAQLQGQTSQQHPFQTSGSGSGGTSATDQLESEFQRLIHSK